MLAAQGPWQCRSISVVPARRGIITVDRENHWMLATGQGMVAVEQQEELRNQVAHLEPVCVE